jgi:hypothetical protein
MIMGMPLTRDFLLFGLVVTFLLLAIGFTAVARNPLSPTTASEILILNTEEPAEITATVPEPGLDRDERLVAMRQAIAERAVRISAPASETPEVTPEADISLFTEATTSMDLPVTGGPNQCADYQLFTNSWNPQSILFQESEGVRVVFTETVLPPTSSAVGTGTSAVIEPAVERTVLAQLPIRSFDITGEYCIPSDVVGIANDGSLIRNSEVGLYGVFGPDTVVGFALDGFPIYGQVPAGTARDECGGLTNATGRYGYYVDVTEPDILRCFNAPPVRL